MVWPVYDAKARFSELLDITLKEGPQVVTRRGVEAAVLVPIDEWRHLNEKARKVMPDPLLDPAAPHDIPLPPRRPVLKLRPFRFHDEGPS
jgi:prevent-host-death family protein